MQGNFGNLYGNPRRYLGNNGMPFNPVTPPNLIQPYDRNLLGQGPFANALQGPPRFEFLRSGSPGLAQALPLLLLLSSLLSLM